MFSSTPASKLAVVLLLTTGALLVGTPAIAAEPGWSPVVIATGEYRRQLESMPIERRPYRPLHFYGNTVRRLHYRGNPLPLPKGIGQTINPVLFLETIQWGR